MYKTIYNYRYGIFATSMFSYGFLREIKSTYKVPHDLIGYKIFCSFLNGFLYTVPPYSALKLFYTINRIDVHYYKKDKDKYESIYNELLGVNKNVLI